MPEVTSTAASDGVMLKVDEAKKHDLNYFVEAVQEYAVFGIVPSKTVLRGKKINPTGQHGFDIYGTDPHMFWDGLKEEGKGNATDKFFRLLKAVRNDRRPETEEFTKKTGYVTLLDTSKAEAVLKHKTYPVDTVVFTYGFIYDDNGQDRENGAMAVTGALMKRDAAEELLELIKTSPQVLEDFYQRIFNGLDSRSDEHTGIIRLKEDGIVIVNRDDLQKVPQTSEYAQNSIAVDQIKSLKKYMFEAPVGVEWQGSSKGS